MHVYSSVIMYDFQISTTFVFSKTNPEKRSFQASWFTNRTPPDHADETYQGVEIVVHSLVVVVETRLNTAK